MELKWLVKKIRARIVDKCIRFNYFLLKDLQFLDLSPKQNLQPYLWPRTSERFDCWVVNSANLPTASNFLIKNCFTKRPIYLLTLCRTFSAASTTHVEEITISQTHTKKKASPFQWMLFLLSSAFIYFLLNTNWNMVWFGYIHLLQD